MVPRWRRPIWRLGGALATLAVLGGVWKTCAWTPHPQRIFGYARDTAEPCLQRVRDADDRALQPNSPVYERDVVYTTKKTCFIDNPHMPTLILGPNSRLIAELSGDPNIFRAQLSIGAARIEGRPETASLVIGSPYGVIRSPHGELSIFDVTIGAPGSLNIGAVTLETEPGVQVVLGTVEIERDGHIIVLRAGQSLRADGSIDSPFSPAPEPTPPVQPWSGLRVIHSHQSAGLGRKSANDRGTRFALQPNDAVVADDGRHDITLGDFGTLHLERGAQVHLLRAQQNPEEEHVTLRLGGAGLAYHLQRPANRAAQTVIRTRQAAATLTPGMLISQGTIATREDATFVASRFGTVTVAGQTIEPGVRITMKAGQPPVTTPLSNFVVPVRDGLHTVIHYHKHAPPVRFEWQPTPATEVISLAKDLAFKQIVFSERLTHGSFISRSIAHQA